MAKLELTHVVVGSGLSRVAGGTTARAGLRPPHSPCCDVEHVGDQVHAEALAEVHRLATRRSLNTVQGVVPALRPSSASSCRRVGFGSGQNERKDARLLQFARRRILGFVNGAASRIRESVRPAGQRGQLKIVAVARDDVEGTARRDIDSGATVQSLKNLPTKPWPPIVRSDTPPLSTKR